jgi:[NiFe] hydrogenase small subunit
MKVSVGLGKPGAEERLAKSGVSRRDFMKFCTTIAAVMGMEASFANKIALALTSPRRPSVVWLHNAECTGCSESILRAVRPFIDDLILDTISLDYHETIMAASGHKAEEALQEAISSPHGFLCVVEGAIPMKDNGIYGMVGGHTMLEINSKILPKALATIAYGTCATYGGVQAARPNPTDAKGINDALKHLGVNAVNIPGCPPNPYNLVGTIVHLLTHNLAIPEMDDLNRPLMFFNETVHELCERLPHYEAGEFAPSFDSEEARKGWCLYQLGCKGPMTYNNCPKVKFNQTNWPVQAGHPCIGCSEPDFWDYASPFYEEA